MSRKTIGIASIIYAVSILLSRLIGLIRESVIGRTLGGGAEADVYWSAFVLPDFLNYLLAGGVLSIVFIPIFSRYLANDDEAGGWIAFSNIANFLTALLIILTAAMWFLTPHITPYIQAGWSPERLAALNELIRIILPAQIFHLTGGLISATLQARDKHTMPALAPVVYTTCIVLGGVLLGPTMGAKGFAWGVLVGSFLGPFGFPLAGAIKHGLRWQLSFNPRHPDFRTYLVLSLPVMLGFSVIVLDDMFIKHFGSWLDDGVISRLQYAKTLMKVPMGVFGLAAGMATFPTLSRIFAEGDMERATKLLIDALALLLVLALIAQAALFAAGPEMAEVIWGRSKFSVADLQEIGLFTGILGLALWAWSAQMLVARGFYAQGRTWTPTVVGSLIALGGYPLYSTLAERFGGLGLAAASGIVVSVYIITLFAVLSRDLKTGWTPAKRLMSLLSRMAVSAATAGYLAILIRDSLADWAAFPRGLIAGCLAIALTTGFAVLLQVEEMKTLWTKVKAIRG
jgi:putative peptidoglycan lipid II flippase